MPKMQVYLPDDLYEQVKSRRPRLNVSAILQDALRHHLTELERHAAMGDAINSYAAEFGAFSEEELRRQSEADRARVVLAPSRRKRSPAA